MDNYKIRVNNVDESERAQRAFFVLGGEWYNQGKVVKNYDFLFLTFYPEEGFIKRGKEMDYFRESDNKEITLPELEELAANHSSNVISESLTELKEKIALAKENKTFEGVTDGDQFLFEATAITESPDKAQERYEAALNFLKESGPTSYYAFRENIRKALKIAAGIQ